jgi:hypothetical protein
MGKPKPAKVKPPSHAFRVSTDEVRLQFRRERAAELQQRLARRQELAPILADEAIVTIPREQGYRIVPTGVLELGSIVEASRDALTRADVTTKQDEAHKAFLVSLVDMGALTLESPLLQLGLRRELIGAATDYLGMVPILEYANVMYSSHTGPELLKSQLYHCDSNEVEQIKIFVLCEAVTPDTGPLTFIPAHQSQLVRDRTGYKYNGRLTDQQVSESLGGLDSEVALVGPPGTTAFIDTSRCLHYGSRLVNENAHRLVVMLQYVTPLGFLYSGDHREAARFRHLASPTTDEMTALVLGAM